MKKTILLLLFIFSCSYLYSQFEGYMEIKMTKKNAKVKAGNNQMQGMDEALKMIKKELKEREDKLKGMKEGDEGYEDLKAEIDAIKTQLKNMGGVTDETDDTPKIENTKFYFSTNAVRYEQENGGEGMGGASILRGDTKKIIVLNLKEKKYMEIDFEFMKSMMLKMKEMGMKKEETPKEKTSFEKTGETKTILGYKCEKWIATKNESITEMWVTLKFSNFFGLFADLGESIMGDAADDKMSKELSLLNAFPLISKELSKDGKLLNGWEVTKVEKGKQNPALFQVPKDFQLMDMNQMMQQNKN